MGIFFGISETNRETLEKNEKQEPCCFKVLLSLRSLHIDKEVYIIQRSYLSLTFYK